MSARRRCAACGKLFRVRPQVPDQNYCSESACQRERKRLWQKSRRSTDPDYRDNQARAQQAWLTRNPDYWRKYRARNSEYIEQDVGGEITSQEGQHGAPFLVSAARSLFALSSGVYRLTVLSAVTRAKMDASLIVKLVPLRGEGER